MRDASLRPANKNGPERNSQTRSAFNGAGNRTRTDDPRFTRAVLYQLSYAGAQINRLQKDTSIFKYVFLSGEKPVLSAKAT